MISAPGCRREKRKATFESSRKALRNQLGHFLAQVKIEASRSMGVESGGGGRGDASPPVRKAEGDVPPEKKLTSFLFRQP